MACATKTAHDNKAEQQKGIDEPHVHTIRSTGREAVDLSRGETKEVEMEAVEKSNPKHPANAQYKAKKEAERAASTAHKGVSKRPQEDHDVQPPPQGTPNRQRKSEQLNDDNNHVKDKRTPEFPNQVTYVPIGITDRVSFSQGRIRRIGVSDLCGSSAILVVTPNGAIVTHAASVACFHHDVLMRMVELLGDVLDGLEDVKFLFLTPHMANPWAERALAMDMNRFAARFGCEAATAFYVPRCYLMGRLYPGPSVIVDGASYPVRLVLIR